MHYFRYRPYSELSLKELLYSEIYFASPEECNDPFDSKTFYSFSENQKKWVKTIQLVCDKIGLKPDDPLVNKVANHICKQCPITFEEAINNDLLTSFPEYSYYKLIIDYIATTLKDLLKVYHPTTRYFVSFSKNNSDPLMWSHYGDKHRGFCLIFKSINNELNLSQHHQKKQIRRPTPNGLAPNMSYGFQDKFIFNDINYLKEVEPLDAFLHMPAYVNADIEKTEEEINKIREKQESHYLQKGDGWSYENESRLILPPPPAWIFAEHVEYTKQERLFNYEPSQLVGIIYGARMIESDKNRIQEIIEDRRTRGYFSNNYKHIVFRFVEFQAKLSRNQRNLEIEPLSLYSGGKIFKTDSEFNRLYTEWAEGIGHERDFADGKSSSRRVQIDK